MNTRTITLLRKQAALLLALFIILGTTASCERGVFCTKGKGDLVTVTFDLETITGFDNASSADVVLTQGEAQSVKVTAQQNIIDRMKRKVSGGNWNIDIDGCISTGKDILVEITLPKLEFAGISGSGTVTATNRFTDLDNVTLSISGSGDMILDMDASHIEASITGSGNIDMDLTATSVTANTSGSGEYRLSGTTDNLSHRVTGSGKCAAFDLDTKTADINVTGSGDCETTVSESLDVSISGSGDVKYKGQPGINVEITGSGNLINAN